MPETLAEYLNLRGIVSIYQVISGQICAFQLRKCKKLSKDKVKYVAFVNIIFRISMCNGIVVVNLTVLQRIQEFHTLTELQSSLRCIEGTAN